MLLAHGDQCFYAFQYVLPCHSCYLRRTQLFRQLFMLRSLSCPYSLGSARVCCRSIFPVCIRGTATGFCFNIGRLVTATAVLFVGILVTALGGYGNSLFIFSLVFVVGLVATFLSKHEKEENHSVLKEKILQPTTEV